MGKMKDVMMWFLENGGYELEYNESTLPTIQDMEIVLDNKIMVWEYKGYKSPEDYYSYTDGGSK